VIKILETREVIIIFVGRKGGSPGQEQDRLSGGRQAWLDI